MLRNSVGRLIRLLSEFPILLTHKILRRTLQSLRIVRAYPSLNLTINVRQPDIWRMFDMMNRVEAAAFHNHLSFLDYASLYKQNYMTIVKACDIEIKSHFYEVTTPKAPLDISVKLVYVGNSTFTTVSEMTCGGKMKASIRLKMYTHYSTGKNSL
ncbi:hypothetical protein KUTeg_018801 [Tegillarca granosa]|uniref:Uncharacterized protein n=1 Tax=Tegillarca granosa TaxID=220873 RepID=A0ABQ9EB52_TEGGR|nr:hypothetical protein KUTeg_018801 [Tegillarca granosa]